MKKPSSLLGVLRDTLDVRTEPGTISPISLATSVPYVTERMGVRDVRRPASSA
jgi:hypothetical protein